MTEPIRLYGDLTAANDDGSLSFKLLPFGEPGMTNKGKLTVKGPGVIKLPSDPSTVHANFEHDFKRPLGKAVALEERQDAIYARFMPADTTAGRDWREEAKEGLRRGISVELNSPVVRNGELLAGELYGAGAVVKPAYPSAQLVTAAEVEDTGDLASALDDAAAAIARAKDTLKPDEEDPAGDPPPPPSDKPVTASSTDKETPAMSKPAVPPLFASSTDKDASKTEYSAGALYAALSAPEENKDLLAAFSTVAKTTNFDIYSQPQYVGEITAAAPYQRRYTDLVRNTPLTSMKVKGWKFVQDKTPIVDDYAGNFAEIPSRAVEITPVEFNAGRVAGGNKVDRIHHDFPDAGFWSGYLRESTADYDRKTDNKVKAMLLAGATPVLKGAAVAGVAPGWSKLVDGILSIWTDYQPNFALIGADLYREMLLTTDKDKLAFLNASLGWTEGDVNGFQFRPIPDAGKVIVGSKDSAELQELPGLIRVSALDVSHAATDEGVYGYNGTWVRDARALVSVVDALV
ncbi:major capsid and protease fusion protein [Arthrobacter phage BlueFeather]|uniref:Major capsid and protease fusion protein n=1 Tax=Arthrobacter phage BlueFeather TaxID=2713258 RepID=A0A6G8R281_9CAUD|nr:major capsid and protease fusion protein [Arthrobacter phage BlueFeather]QIN94309.1 major capsid and protease fusion protein [Arthrobacter phage BlueFeather]